MQFLLIGYKMENLFSQIDLSLLLYKNIQNKAGSSPYKNHYHLYIYHTYPISLLDSLYSESSCYILSIITQNVYYKMPPDLLSVKPLPDRIFSKDKPHNLELRCNTEKDSYIVLLQHFHNSSKDGTFFSMPDLYIIPA